MSGERNGRGERHLKIKATVRNRSITFPTNIYVKKEQFASEEVVNHQQCIGLNAMLSKCIMDLQNVEIELFRREIDLTINSLYSCYNEHIASDTPLTEFCDYVMKNCTNRKKHTKDRYYDTVKQIDRFHKGVCLEDIDVGWLKKFEKYELSKGVQDSTVWGRMKVIRALFNEAIKRDLLRANQNPFRFYEIPEIRSRNDVLMFEEIEELELMGFNSGAERHVRDIFCFAAYCGLRFSDVMKLKKENLRENGGVTWLQVKTQKTGAYVQIPISIIFFGNAMRILEKYEDIEHLCNYESNTTVNRILKTVIQKAGVGGGQRITMHTARRSFVTCLADFGVPIATIQKLVGHSRITTTQHYCVLSTGTIQKDLENVFSDGNSNKIVHVEVERNILRVTPSGHKLFVGSEVMRCRNCSFFFAGGKKNNTYKCSLFKKRRSCEDWCDSFSEKINGEDSIKIASLENRKEEKKL